MLIKKVRPSFVVSQKELFENVSEPEWRTKHIEMLEIASQYFDIVEVKDNLSLEKLKKYIDNGYGIIANIWDSWPDIQESKPEGHYLVVDGLDLERKEMFIIDPSNANRLNGKNRQYTLEFSEFLSHWYDFEEKDNQGKVDHWALLVKLDSFKF